MKTFNCDKFLNTFKAYFDLTVEKGRTTYYYGKKDLTIYYNTEDYLKSDDLRIMTMDFKCLINANEFSLFVRIPLDKSFKKNTGMVINSQRIRNEIKKAKAYLPIFKKLHKASYNGRPYLNIGCKVTEVTDERGILRYKISDVDYYFEISYNIQENGHSDICPDFITMVESHFREYFKSVDLDVEGVDYKRKLELYNMMEI